MPEFPTLRDKVNSLVVSHFYCFLRSSRDALDRVKRPLFLEDLMHSNLIQKNSIQNRHLRRWWSLILPRTCVLVLFPASSFAQDPSAVPEYQTYHFNHKDSESWLLLYDPTLISDRFVSDWSYEDRTLGQSLLEIDSTIRRAIPVHKDLAFGYQVGIPTKSFHDDSGEVSGLGDLHLRGGYVGRFSSTLRWGFGMRAAFDTATAPELGDGVFQLRQISALRWDATETLNLGVNVEYSFTPQEEGTVDINALELKFPAAVKLSDRLSASASYNPRWNFENDSLRQRLELLGSHAFGSKRQYVVSLGGEIPLVSEAFQWKLLTSITCFF